MTTHCIAAMTTEMSVEPSCPATFTEIRFAFGAAPLTLLVAFLGVVALAHDACRFILTEGCLTRLQQLIASSGALSSRSKAPPLGLSAAQSAMLSERSSGTFVDQRVADQSSVVR